jgi:molybdopterin synthase sulfur carrier subunit
VARGTVRFWAAARQAAGVAEEPFEAETLADVLATATARHGELAQVLPGCSFVVDDQPVGGRDPAGVRIGDGTVVEVLPPFAGGAQ